MKGNTYFIKKRKDFLLVLPTNFCHVHDLISKDLTVFFLIIAYNYLIIPALLFVLISKCQINMLFIKEIT